MRHGARKFIERGRDPRARLPAGAQRAGQQFSRPGVVHLSEERDRRASHARGRVGERLGQQIRRGGVPCQHQGTERGRAFPVTTTARPAPYAVGSMLFDERGGDESLQVQGIDASAADAHSSVDGARLSMSMAVRARAAASASCSLGNAPAS